MTDPRPVEPPRLAERLLRVWLPRGVVGDSIIGDAREEFAEYVRRRGGRFRAMWYWLHALRLAANYAWRAGPNNRSQHDRVSPGERVRALLSDIRNAKKWGEEVEMGTLLKDLKFGVRSIRRMPGSAAVSVVVLALGIGLCSFMFSLIYGIYFRGLDVPESDRLVNVWSTDIQRSDDQNSVSIHDFMDWRERQRSFEALSGYSSGTVNVAGSERPRRYAGAFVTANVFDVVGVLPMLGRSFQEGEDVAGAPLNLILGYTAWRDHYGSDSGVIGRDVRVNGEPATIIGVMPEGFEYPNNHEVWVPMRADVLGTPRRRGQFLTVVGRLAAGVSIEQAQLEFAGIARQLEQEYPESNEGVGAQVLTIIQSNTDETLNMVFGAMMVAVISVLLVACANVANLLLARAAMRTKEAGIRIALGGGRLRVMLPFFAEALVLAGIGAILGIGIAYVGVAWFDGVTDPSRTGRPYFMQFMVDVPILLFVVGLTLLTALVAGVAPAWQMSRTDVNSVLKDESRGSTGLHMGRLSRILVTAEVALSCALLVGAGLMTKSMVNVGAIDHVYETDGLFTARAGLFQADYPDTDSRLQLWRDLKAELQALPQVASAALTTNLPYAGSGTLTVALMGVDYGDADDMPQVNHSIVSTDYFETLGTIVTSGRDFGDQDDQNSERVAIVNQPFVDRYFDGRSPVGAQFRVGAADTLPYLTVIGVVPDMQMQGSLPEGFPGYEPAGYYVPLEQSDASFISMVVIPRAGDALALTSDIRDAVRRLDPDLPIYDVWTQATVIARQNWFFGVFGTVFIVFGLAALFMASVGLYGVLSFAVTRRTQEMGIRMALGAGSRQVVGLVARQGARQLGLGLFIGMGLAFGLTRLIGVIMYNVDPQDPLIFGGVFTTIVVVGMAAAVFPAIRATSVDPVVALRAE